MVSATRIFSRSFPNFNSCPSYTFSYRSINNRIQYFRIESHKIKERPINGKIAFRISAVIMLLALAGIAFVIYNADVTTGLPVTVNATESQIFSTATGPATSVHSADTVVPFRVFATATLPSPTATALRPQPTNTTILASKPLIPSPTFTPIPTITPVLDEISSFCRNKIPTNLIFVNPNATFELLMAQNLKYGQQVLKTLSDGTQVLYTIQTDGRPGQSSQML